MGDADAQYLMGERYSEGEDVYPEDTQKPFSWYQKAAEQCHDAMIEFGKAYLDSRNYPLAEKWLRGAAEDGHNKDAYYWLGKCLLAQKRYDVAFLWFENGAKVGDKDCAEMVAYGKSGLRSSTSI